MKLTEAYRLFRKGLLPKTLVHSWHGSRVLPLDKVLEAQRFMGRNPSVPKTGFSYLTGWHVGKTYADVDQYRKKWFKRPDKLVVCRVLVDQLEPKPRGRKGIYLSRFMKILSKDWSRAIILRTDGELIKPHPKEERR